MKPGPHSAREGERAFDVRIGINPISWSNDDLPSLGGEIPLETALSEGKAIGYEGFELGNKFPREPKALRDVLARHGLSLVSGWYSGRLARRSVDEEIEAVGPHLRLLAENGANVMVYGEVADAIQGEPQAALPAAAVLSRRAVARIRRQAHGVRPASLRSPVSASAITITWARMSRRRPTWID